MTVRKVYEVRVEFIPKPEAPDDGSDIWVSTRSDAEAALDTLFDALHFAADDANSCASSSGIHVAEVNPYIVANYTTNIFRAYACEERWRSLIIQAGGTLI